MSQWSIENWKPWLHFVQLCLSVYLLFITLNCMPRLQIRYCSPAKLICPVEACRKECRTHSGLTQHLYAKHKDYHPGTPPSAAAVNDRINLDSDLSSVDDVEMSKSIPSDSDLGAWDVFGSNHDSVDFDSEIPRPFLPPSRPDSPSQESEASSIFKFIEYHPLINGR